MRTEVTRELALPDGDGCPALDDLRRLLETVVLAGDEHRLARHLDGCPHCRERLDSLAGQPPLGGGLQPAGPALRRAMDSLSAPPRRPLTREAADEMVLRLLTAPRADGKLGCLGPYEVTEVIGRGGFGVVFKAFDPALHRFVAIKVLAPQLAASVAARLRFTREARAAAAISHEHVVAIHDTDEANGLAYLVMEYVAGISLQERLDRDGALRIEELLRIGVQTATGLAAAHAQGLIHRDVKPANILLEHGMERVKITDFGLARAADDASLTQSGSVAGTPPYMAPEQARGEPLDHRADLFGLGSVLYAMCTGHPPFQGGTLAVLRQVGEGPPPPVRHVNPEVPGWLEAILSRLHAHDPAGRFDSATEVADLLNRCLAHVQRPSHTPAPQTRPVRPAGRARLPWALSLLGVAAGTIGVALLPRGLPPKRPGVAKAVPTAPPARLRATLMPTSTPIFSAAFTPASEALALGSYDGSVRLWNLDTRAERPPLLGLNYRVWSVAFSGDGKLAAGASGSWSRPTELGALQVWDLRSGTPVASPRGHDGLVFSAAFSPADPALLASGGWDGTVRLWSAGTGGQRRVLLGHAGPVRSVAFRPDGRALASGGFDGSVRLWDVSTGRPLWRRELGRCQVNCVAFSPDGRTLAAAENPLAADAPPVQGRPPGLVRLLDAASGEPTAGLAEARGMVLSVAFSPDGAFLASGGGRWRDYGEVSLWDPATGQVRQHLIGHEQWVECVAFSPDGRSLVSAGGTEKSMGEMKLWDLGEPPGLPPAFSLSPLPARTTVRPVAENWMTRFAPNPSPPRAHPGGSADGGLVARPDR